MPSDAKPRPRTKPPAERRDELLNAAQQLFLAHGVAATTIEQITAAAGVAKGSFYLHFGSKEDVLAALRQRFARMLLARIGDAVAARPAADWRGKLAAWAAAGIAAYAEADRLHDILFYAARPPTRDGLVDNIVIDHLRDLLRAGGEAGAWPVDDPTLTAIFLFSGLHGIVEHAGAAAKHPERRRLTRQLERLCFRTVGLVPPA